MVAIFVNVQEVEEIRYSMCLVEIKAMAVYSALVFVVECECE